MSRTDKNIPRAIPWETIEDILAPKNFSQQDIMDARPTFDTVTYDDHPAVRSAEAFVREILRTMVPSPEIRLRQAQTGNEERFWQF